MGSRVTFAISILSFFVGIIYATLGFSIEGYTVWAFCLLDTGAVLFLMYVGRYRLCTFLSICTLTGLILGYSYGAYHYREKVRELSRTEYRNTEKTLYTGTVVKKLYRNEYRSTYHFLIDNFANFATGGELSTSSPLRVFLSVPSNLSLSVGDRVRVTGKLENTLDIPITGFERYAFFHDGFAQIRAYSFERLQRGGEGVLEKWGKYWEILFERHFPRDIAATLLGMTIGSTDLFTREVKEDFLQSGLTHILVVSGSNIAFLIVFMTFFLKYIHIKKSMERCVTASVIILYGSLVGWDMTVLRASIMGILSYMVITTGKNIVSLSLLLFTAFILTLFFPLAPVYDAGFGLSFSATLGIILFHTPISKVLSGWGMPKWSLPFFALPISATIGSFPVMLYHFSAFSPVSLISNTLVAGILGFILFSGVLFGVIASVSSYLGYLFGYLVYIPTYFLLRVSDIFGGVSLVKISPDISNMISIFLLGYFSFIIIETSLKPGKLYAK